ncbi:Hypothetical predicted protein, partial [Marmota monax]
KIQCAIGFNTAERHKALVKGIDDVSADTPRTALKHSHENNVYLPKPVEAFKEWKRCIIK